MQHYAGIQPSRCASFPLCSGLAARQCVQDHVGPHGQLLHTLRPKWNVTCLDVIVCRPYTCALQSLQHNCRRWATQVASGTGVIRSHARLATWRGRGAPPEERALRVWLCARAVALGQRGGSAKLALPDSHPIPLSPAASACEADMATRCVVCPEGARRPIPRMIPQPHGTPAHALPKAPPTHPHPLSCTDPATPSPLPPGFNNPIRPENTDGLWTTCSFLCASTP